jgi:S-DNA-T family DNA segregation ATPase FtsK/SpoIIIE
MAALGTAGTVVFALAAGGGRFLAAAVAITTVTLVASLAVALAQRRAAAAQARRAAARYRAHLAACAEQARQVAGQQQAHAARLHPDPAVLPDLAAAREHTWERRPGDPDFLRLRVGLGAVPLAAPVAAAAADPLGDHDPGLHAEAAALVEHWRLLPGMPVAVPLAGAGPLVVAGDPGASRALARALLCQLAVWHAPGEVQLLAYVDAANAGEWQWLKWLPHVHQPADPPWAVTVATDPADLALLLDRLVAPRLAAADHDQPASSDPERLVVLVDGYAPDGPAGQLPLLARGDAAGVTVLLLAGERQLPSQAGAVAHVDPAGRLDYLQAGPDGHRERGLRADAMGVAAAEAAARALAPLPWPAPPLTRAATVHSAGLLDLLAAAGSPADRHAADRSAAAPLRAPIGTDQRGSPVYLDLKEAADGGMGPHGCVVGATGSGKSELLRTLVAGLALGHHPDELALVLVDYKGGATFAEVARLPHVAGLITNLERDQALVGRMRDALFGELERRQRLLAAHGLDRAGDYQAHRASHPGAGLPPLPSLLVIIDEFGELLDAQPHVVDLLVSIGRTGRSLGVHLLLASQRLQGAGIHGLDGHLRYRVCLRTFSPEDSMAVLGTRAAFALPPLPGLGYPAVDGATTRFKAALATRPWRAGHAPAATARPLRAFSLTGAGQVLASLDDHGAPAGPQPPPAAEANTTARTELQVAVDAASAARRARQVWLPSLPAALPLGQLLASGAPARPGMAGWLRLPLGLLDRPRDQAQPPLVVDLAGAAGHLAVVGAPGTGRSTLLQTLIGALALTHHPTDVQVYAIDLGGGRLHALASLPHVAVVCGRGQADLVRRVVRELRAIVDQRATACRAHRLAGMPAWHAARAAGRLGDVRHGEVLLLVDNWAALTAELPDLVDELVALAATALPYGIHLVIVANRWADLRTGLRDSLGGRLELRLGDPADSLLDRHAAKAVPGDVPGRGLATGGIPFQAAVPHLGGPNVAGTPGDGLDHLLATAAACWRDAPAAEPVRLLPSTSTPTNSPAPPTTPPSASPSALRSTA